MRAPLVRSIGVRGAIVLHEAPAVLARIDALALNELGAYDNELAAALATFFASPHLARLRRLELVRARLDADALAAIAEVPCPLEHLRIDVTYPYEPFSIDGAALAARFARRGVRSLELVGFDGVASVRSPPHRRASSRSTRSSPTTRRATSSSPRSSGIASSV